MKKHLIAPSLLAADFMNLEREVMMVNQSSADWLHMDVMDGRFVPNISFGTPILQAVGKLTTKPMDVHLMIESPEDYFETVVACGASSVSFHLEATHHPHRAIQQLKALGVKAGIAINPHTSEADLQYVLEDLEYVCMMSVNPGWGGQKFIYSTLRKIEKLRSEIISRNLSCLIQVDGGVGLQNANALLASGADILVAGSSIFGQENPSEAIAAMKSIDVRILEL